MYTIFPSPLSPIPQSQPLNPKRSPPPSTLCFHNSSLPFKVPPALSNLVLLIPILQLSLCDCLLGEYLLSPPTSAHWNPCFMPTGVICRAHQLNVSHHLILPPNGILVSKFYFFPPNISHSFRWTPKPWILNCSAWVTFDSFLHLSISFPVLLTWL